MCGIAGYCLQPNSNLPDWRARLRQFAETLSHRGPDNAGYALWDGEHKFELRADDATLEAPTEGLPRLGLMHRRLSIIDTAARSNQPMQSADGRYLLIYNGEIYNYIELRAELEQEGCKFQTASDTEVLLQALITWGPQKACYRALGMFAFCLVDHRSRTVVLGRDAFGIKPLFYARPANGLLFASEIKAMLGWPGISRQANPETVRSYLAMGLVNYNDSSFFCDIESVPPGHWIRFPIDTPHKLEKHYFLKPQSNRLTASDLSRSEATTELRRLFLDSVRLHMRSDVGYGALLSGGLDSSAIVGAMHTIGSPDAIRCYSFVSPGDPCNEAHWAKMVTDRYNCTTQKISANASDLFGDLEQLVKLQDEPFGSTSIYAQFRIFDAIRRDGQTVVLDGQGADEIFAGYLPYYSAHMAGMVKSGQIGKALKLLNALSRQGQGGRVNLLLRMLARLMPESIGTLIQHWHVHKGQDNVVNWSWFDQAGARSNYEPVSGLQGSLSDVLHYDLVRNNLPGLLRYEDRNSMHFSVESRVPYLSLPLVEFVQKLPEDWLIDETGRNKAIFRDAIADLVPQPILDRRDKIGFATPEERWFKESYEQVDALLTTTTDLNIPFLDVTAARKQLKSDIHAGKGFDRQIWRWINLATWSREFSVEYR